jgi:hypothetical protein
MCLFCALYVTKCKQVPSWVEHLNWQLQPLCCSRLPRSPTSTLHSSDTQFQTKYCIIKTVLDKNLHIICSTLWAPANTSRILPSLQPLINNISIILHFFFSNYLGRLNLKAQKVDQCLCQLIPDLWNTESLLWTDFSKHSKNEIQLLVKHLQKKCSLELSSSLVSFNVLAIVIIMYLEFIAFEKKILI